ncbi:phenylalanine racemase [Listeria grandensis]|uniref:Phenylalanine racemase n=2 Tax=Listeria grandensis TaxID=1494963 RepID=A0A7X0Y603_9LIST|nr:phenylalanine racemase [Listeria grandensis]
MSRTEFEGLTEVEKMFIRKEYENKFIHDTTWARNSVYNATVNANRKKNTRMQELHTKKQSKADVEYNENAIQIVEEMEAVQGKSWVDMIYQANGKQKPTREVR